MRNKIGSILWGVAFILAGIGVAGNVLNFWSFNIIFDGWWTLFIIVPCSISIIQNGFNTGNSIGLAIGGLMLLSQQEIIPWDFSMKMFLPIALVIIGLSIILRPAYSRKSYKSGGQYAKWDADGVQVEGGANVEYSVHNDGRDWNTSCGNEILAVFCGNDGSFYGREFKGGSCTAIFGGIDFDLRGAIINKDVTINATALFGGIDIYTDNKVQVVYRGIPIFGGVGCKVPPRDKSLPTLFVNCVSAFGGIDIR